MDRIPLTEGAKVLVNEIIAPFIEENQDIMMADEYFSGYYRDTIEDGVRNIRPIFDFDPFLIPIICKVIVSFSPDLPQGLRNITLKRYLIDLKLYLNSNNNQMLIRIKNNTSKTDDDAFLVFYFSLDLNFTQVTNTCAEFLL